MTRLDTALVAVDTLVDLLPVLGRQHGRDDPGEALRVPLPLDEVGHPHLLLLSLSGIVNSE